MTGFILRILTVMLGLWLASALVPGIEVQGMGTLIGAALLLGFVNAVVRPLLIVLTFAGYDFHPGPVFAGGQCRDAGAGCMDVRRLQYRRFLAGAVGLHPG